jgi:integrase
MRYKRYPALTNEQIEAKPPGRHYQGYGLVLIVNAKGRRYWMHRYTKPSTGRPTETAIGDFPTVNYAGARQVSQTWMVDILNGIDPVEVDRAKREAKRTAHANRKTFGEVCTDWINKKKSDKEHPWSESTARSAERYCFVHGAKLVNVRVVDVTANKIREALEHLFTTAPVQAHRARAKFKAALDYAEEMGWRQGPNPAREELHRHTWPSLPDGDGFAGMPSEDVPAFYRGLFQLHDLRADAVKFLNLTATRRDETRLAQWSEFKLDCDKPYWTVPKSRKKERRSLRIPLSNQAVDVLKRLPGYHNRIGFVFSYDGQKPLPQKSMLQLLREMNVPYDIHGFRKSFKNWTRRTSQPWDLSEMSLAHLVGTQTAQVYATEDALEERRPIMEAWASYCSSAPKPALRVVSATR